MKASLFVRFYLRFTALVASRPQKSEGLLDLSVGHKSLLHARLHNLLSCKENRNREVLSNISEETISVVKDAGVFHRCLNQSGA